MKKSKNAPKRGFTLIELLVVIAIIGILGSILTARINAARNKARDAAIKSQLGSMRTKAEVFSTVNGNYGSDTTTSCDPSDPDDADSIFDSTQNENISSLIAKVATDKNNDPTDFTDITCGADQNGWVVAAVLEADASVTWCADSDAYNDVGTPDTTDMECD